MSYRTSAVCVLLSAAALIASDPVAAQVRASERAMVGQTIDGTVITVDYSRLNLRGRTNIYGGVIPWGKVWTGANWAMTLEASKDITIGGHELPAGTYSVWLEVQPDEWTAIFDPEPRRFHLFPPPPSDDQVRFPVTPHDVATTELLTWSFDEVTATGGMLTMAWADKAVSFEIGVEPTHDIRVSEDFARPFVGAYRLAMGPVLGGRTVDFTIRYAGDRLEATWSGAPNPALTTIWLVHIGSDVFFPVETRNGEMADMLVDLWLEFAKNEDGEITGFEMRALDDELWATGQRVN